MLQVKNLIYLLIGVTVNIAFTIGWILGTTYSNDYPFIRDDFARACYVCVFIFTNIAFALFLSIEEVSFHERMMAEKITSNVYIKIVLVILIGLPFIANAIVANLEWNKDCENRIYYHPQMVIVNTGNSKLQITYKEFNISLVLGSNGHGYYANSSVFADVKNGISGIEVNPDNKWYPYPFNVKKDKFQSVIYKQMNTDNIKICGNEETNILAVLYAALQNRWQLCNHCYKDDYKYSICVQNCLGFSV